MQELPVAVMEACDFLDETSSVDWTASDNRLREYLSRELASLPLEERDDLTNNLIYLAREMRENGEGGAIEGWIAKEIRASSQDDTDACGLGVDLI